MDRLHLFIFLLSLPILNSFFFSSSKYSPSYYTFDKKNSLRNEPRRYFSLRLLTYSDNFLSPSKGKRYSVLSLKSTNSPLTETKLFMPQNNSKARSDFSIVKASKKKKTLKVKKIKKQNEIYLNVTSKQKKKEREPPSYEPIPLYFNSISQSYTRNLALNSSFFSFSSFTNGSFILRMDGDPIALARHRMTRRGMMYNPSGKAQRAFAEKFIQTFPFLSFPKTEKEIEQISDSLSSPPLASTPSTLSGPLQANFIFAFQRPKAHYRQSKKVKILKDIHHSIWHQQRKGNNFLYFSLF